MPPLKGPTSATAYADMATAGFVHANDISHADSPILRIGITDRVRMPDDTSRSVLEDHAGLNDSKKVIQPVGDRHIRNILCDGHLA